MTSLLAVALALVGCTQYQPFDSLEHLRGQLSARLGPERARSLAVPFELDDEIRAVIEERISLAGDERARLDQVQDFIFGSVGLQYSLVPTYDAVGTFRAHQGNCLSFVNLFVGIARHRRLNPFYVEVQDYQRWSYRDGMVVSQGHIVAGIYVDGRLTTFDFLPYRPKSYRDFQPLDDLTAVAHHYNNLGAEALMTGDLDAASELLALATAIAPDFAKAANNYGVVLLRRDEVAPAVEVLETALEAHPGDVAVLTNLARGYQRLGRTGEAQELLAQIEDAQNTNPFYFVYRGELALGQGDLATALELMRKAYRLESESPKVHLGLTQVYVALGDLERARHHVERALKLDATNADARKYALLLAGRGKESS